jgi:hypothetical protein
MELFCSSLGRPNFARLALRALGRGRKGIITGLALSVLGWAQLTSAEVPQGVFSITNDGQPINSAVLSNRHVDGITVRTGWAAVEPTEGNFDWSYLDSTIAAAGAAGKQVLLRIGTMGKRPAWVDTAVRSAGGKFFTFTSGGETLSIPLFWDPVFLAKKKALIAALGARYTNNPAVAIIVTSFANAESEDWNVPHTSDLIPQWLKLGYTTEKLLGAGRQIIDGTMRAFPNQYVTLAVGGDGPNLDPSLNYVASTIVATERAIWPGRLIAQKNSLSTYVVEAPANFGTIWRLIWDSRPDVGAQMLFWCFGDSEYRVNDGVPIDPALALTRSINVGLTYQLNYIEIYQKDVVNLPAVITYAHDALTGR